MSIGAKEIAFSCYAVTDFDRALDFYQNTLGLTLAFSMPPCDGPRWAEFDIGGAALGIGKAPGMEPSSKGCSVALEVDDFEAALARLRETGVTITFGPMDSGVCRMAGIADPDGNPILIHQRHPQPTQS